jgi:hypothetical protein
MQRVLLILLLATIGPTVAAPLENQAQVALSLHAQESMAASRSRQAAHYAENRQRCQAALRVAELCGKFAGKFSCDEKGFKTLADKTGKPAIPDPAGASRMERCAVDAAGKNGR